MLAVVLAGGGLVASARADGDPASDVLVSQSLFLPADDGVPSTQQAQLATLLKSSARSGYELRVALIARPADLGSVSALWRQPQNYARFLGEELSLVFRGTLLVVMPNGFGVYRSGGPVATELAALARATPAAGHTSLGATALAAVQQLAAAAGHRLTVSSTSVRPRAGSVDVAAWLAFAVGLGVMGMAWVASFRVQPPRRLGRPSSGPAASATPGEP